MLPGTPRLATTSVAQGLVEGGAANEHEPLHVARRQARRLEGFLGRLHRGIDILRDQPVELLSPQRYLEVNLRSPLVLEADDFILKHDL